MTNRRVLFVCTGNIFRSLAAEHALRRALGERDGVHVSSAGTADYPYEVRPNVREHLRIKGFDVSAHPRALRRCRAAVSRGVRRGGGRAARLDALIATGEPSA